MRLIDADKLLADNGMGVICSACEQNEYECGYYHDYTLMDFCNMVDIAPTVDAVPARHGFWVIADADKGEYICSVCGETDTDCSDRYSNHNVFGQNYCPNCGAKMDGDENG